MINDESAAAAAPPFVLQMMLKVLIHLNTALPHRAHHDHSLFTGEGIIRRDFRLINQMDTDSTTPTHDHRE